MPIINDNDNNMPIINDNDDNNIHIVNDNDNDMHIINDNDNNMPIINGNDDKGVSPPLLVGCYNPCSVVLVGPRSPCRHRELVMRDDASRLSVCIFLFRAWPLAASLRGASLREVLFF